MIVIRNGIVNLNQEWHKVDLQIADGKIVRISHSIKKAPYMEEIDAQGRYIIPGMIDMHVHIDDYIGNYYLADTYRSGTEVAIRNGITSFYTFITEQDNESSSEAILKALRKTDNNIFCNVGYHVTMKPLSTMIDLYEHPQDGYAFKSIKLYTTYKKAGIYTSYHEMEEYFKYFDKKPVQFLIHCEDEAVLEQSALGFRTSDFALPEGGQPNAFNHTILRPPEAEIEAIRKVIEIASKYDVKIHIVHVSIAEGVEMIEDAACNMNITCETAPHYLYVNEEQLAQPNGHRWLCSPPLRSEENRLALVKLAERGKINVFATDHCAFLKKDKDENKEDFRLVPGGIPGIGALPHLVYQLDSKLPEESLLFMSRHLSKNPAKIMGLFPHKGIITEGADADLCIVDIHGDEQHITSSLSDTYEPYPKVKSKLQFTHVLLNGHLVVQDGKLIDHNSPKGELLCLS